MLTRTVRLAVNSALVYRASSTELPSKAVFIKNTSCAAPPLVPVRNHDIAEDRGCWLCQNGLQDFDYRDVLVLRQFIRDGYMKTGEETGICFKMQIKLKPTIRKAIKHKLLPEEILTEEGYWALGPETVPPEWSDTEHLYGRTFRHLYPENYKYKDFRLGPILPRINENVINDSPRCMGRYHFRKSTKSFRDKWWKREIRRRLNCK